MLPKQLIMTKTILLKTMVTLLASILVVVLLPFNAIAQQKSDASKNISKVSSVPKDGQHEFDFEIGTWKTQLKRLLKPLTGSTTWVEYEGTTVVRKIWGSGSIKREKIHSLYDQTKMLSLSKRKPCSQWQN